MTAGKKVKGQQFQWSSIEDQKPERAIVIVPEFPDNRDEASHSRSRESRLNEAIGLAEAIKLEIVHTSVVAIKAVKPATLMGTGKVAELADIVDAKEIGLAIVDHSLSPVQQRNLEKAWDCKVLDRTGIILEIFGDRAKTKEGRLQVELAHLNYQKGRLVRQWTHLERQRGGAGFMGGPGETQIEADRREIQGKILRLERDLEKVRKTRQLHRSQRKKVPHPIVALVGYTNAGKSTLFNRVTGSKVLAKDMLFATLDPTLRQLELPGGFKVILSDTVGFVSNLPTDLVAAFRATLEEVLEADLILHVRDSSDPDHRAQARDVYAILQQLGISDTGRDKVIEVWNKIDLLNEQDLAALESLSASSDQTVLVSATTGQGLDKLLMLIETEIAGEELVQEIVLVVSQLHLLPWIYETTRVENRADNEDGSVTLQLKLSKSAHKSLINKQAKLS